MLKTIFIHYTSDILGGSDKSLYELVESLDKSHILPIMILKKNDPMIIEYEKLNIKVYSLIFYGPPKKLFSKRAFLFLLTFIPSIFHILKIIKKEKPETIHINTSLNIQGGLGAYFSKVPFVWHIREIMGNGILDSLIKKIVCKLSTKTIAISNAVKENYNCKNTAIIYNGMNLEEYKILKKTKNKENIVITCIGRFEEWKGQHILVESLPRVLKSQDNILVQFVGGAASAKPEYLKKVTNRVLELHLSNKVKFLGLRNDVPKILSKTDILVVPTSTSEPFGRTIIEGMASECIVIATASGGPLEIINNNKTGFLITPNSVNELSNILIKITDNIDAYHFIGSEAKKVVYKQYDIKRVASEIELKLKELKK